MINIIKKYNIPTLIKVLKLMEKRSLIFILLILIFNVIEAVSVPLSAYGIKGVIDGITTSNMSLFWHSIMLVAINNILWIIYSPISAYGCAWASKKTMCNLKTQFTDHLLKVPQKYHDSKPVGDLLSIMSNDIDCFQNIYDWEYFEVVRHAVVGVSGLITMLVIDWRFALIVLVLGTLSVYITSYFSKKLEKTGEDLQKQLSENNIGFYELIKAMKTIRLLGLSNKKTKDFDEATEHEGNIRIKSSIINAKMSSLLTFINSFSYIIILILGGIFVYYRLSDWGTIIALAGLKTTADCLFSECGMHMAKMQTNLAGVKRVLKIINEQEEVVDVTKYSFQSKLNSYNTVLTLQDVDFSYDDKVKVLKSVNFSLETGKLVALAGESGSGKSSLVKVLMSLYEPTSGSIVYKDDSQLEVSWETLRSKTAYVPQDAMLFDGTIFDNIACGNENASYNDVVLAAKAAEADEFITQLPKGYDTKLADDGKSLSGGQRQRIAIARALVKNAPILLLDEITSALDRDNEAKILKTISALKKDRAILLITHKDDVKKYADEILTIDKGVIS